MQYFKRNTKYSILSFLVIVLSITTSISTLAKTEVYFTLCDSSKILPTTFLKPEVQTINFNTASQDEIIKVLQIFTSLAQKILTLREKIGLFKDPRDLLQLPEISNLEWEE